MSRSRRFRSLDGWRALSIILVLGSHSKGVIGFPKSLDTIFNWCFDGDMGVRFFFVISGFLITSLLLRETEGPNEINLKSFYIRRALRILPVYFAFLLTMFAFQCFTEWRQDGILWLCNLTFLTNFVYHPGYGWTTGHLWSLAVEEQFYLIWPILLKLSGGSVKAISYILTVPLIVAPVARIITYLNLSPSIIHPLFQWSSPLNYFDSLAVGCIASVLFEKHGQNLSSILTRFKSWTIILATALLLVPYILSKCGLAVILTTLFGPTLQAFGFAILLVQSILLPSLFMPLNLPLISKLGVLSYSVYIWQEIFCSNPRFFGFSTPLFMSFPWWLVATLITAMLSYYCLEKPLMGLRSKLRSRSI